MEKKKNVILDLSFEYALEIIKYSEVLENKKKFVLSRQILKSGTSIGANVSEAQGCESRLDFIHKLKIAAKEAEETEYWLLLCMHSENYPDTSALFEKLKSIQKLLSRIISSTKQNS